MGEASRSEDPHPLSAKTSPKTESPETELPSGIVAFVKRDCPTCELVAPVLAELARRVPLAVYSQDDPAFPAASRRRRRHGSRRLLAPRDRSRPDAPARRRRPRGRARRRLAPRRVAGPDGRRRPRGRAARMAARLRLAVRRSGPRTRPRAPLQPLEAERRGASRSRRSRTSTRPASTAAGATAFPSCRRPRRACWRCSAGRRGPPTRSSPSCPPISFRARSRRSRSTRSWPAASPNIFRSC